MNANAKAQGGATLSLNLFADLHTEEFMLGKPVTPRTSGEPKFTSTSEGTANVGQKSARHDAVNWEKVNPDDIQYFPEIEM